MHCNLHPKTSCLLTDILDATNVCVQIGSFCKYYAVSEWFMQWVVGWVGAHGSNFYYLEIILLLDFRCYITRKLVQSGIGVHLMTCSSLDSVCNMVWVFGVCRFWRYTSLSAITCGGHKCCHTIGVTRFFFSFFFLFIFTDQNSDLYFVLHYVNQDVLLGYWSGFVALQFRKNP